MQTNISVRYHVTYYLLIGLFFTGGSFSYAADTPPPAEAIVVAPDGLTPRETHELEREYRYEYRQKGQLLSPFITTGAGDIMMETEARARTEQEKLYRYFGVATKLQGEGRLDEAIEIMKYIVERRPDDKYVKDYLNKLIKQRKSQKREWDVRSQQDSRKLKNKRVKDLMQEGIGYYQQQRFDMALVRFTDVLALDPGNKEARKYYDKLKDYYLKEVKVEGIVKKYDEKIGESESAETEEKSFASAAMSCNESQLVTGDMEQKEQSPYSTDMVKPETKDLAELNLTVEEIVADKKKEERRRNLYTLGKGDVIKISVRDHPEFSERVQIGLNGEAVIPLINEAFKAEGLTIEEASDRATEILKKYVRDPVVAIDIVEFKSKLFYVIDEVGCTPYPITRPNFTLRDAMFLADWGTNRALGRVIVMKPQKLHPIVKKVNAFDVIYRGNLVNNLPIENGDVIYAPMTIAGKVTMTVNDGFIAPMKAIKAMKDSYVDLKKSFDESSLKEMTHW